MSNSKQNLVPAAREALDKFKMESASEEEGSDTTKPLYPDADSILDCFDMNSSCFFSFAGSSPTNL